jgi:hypothetical protein
VRLTIRTADESTVRLLDGLVVFWVVLWLVIGGWSGYTIWQVSELGDTVTTSGEALDSAGKALESVGEVPVVGDRPAELGQEVVATADDIAARGQEVKSQLRQLSLLLGLSIMLMPTTPVVGLYLPLRWARRREVAELRRALTRHGRDGSFDRYLAERAMQTLPYRTVHSIVGDPWQAIAEGRAGPLAEAELRRLGLRRPARMSR